MAEHQLKVRCRVERRTRSTISNQKFADSLLEGSGFEPSVPLLRKALLGVANRRRRHEGRSHLQVRDGDACLEWFPIAIPFAVGPMVRIRLRTPAGRMNDADGRGLRRVRTRHDPRTDIGGSRGRKSRGGGLAGGGRNWTPRSVERSPKASSQAAKPAPKWHDSTMLVHRQCHGLSPSIARASPACD